MKTKEEMTKVELREKLSYWRKQFVKFRFKEFPYQDYEYEDYNTYYAIYNLGLEFVHEIRSRGESKSCKVRIDSFFDQSFKAEKMLDEKLNWL